MNDINTSPVEANFDVAIIGMSGRFPGSENIEEFWNNLCRGVESVEFFSEAELSRVGIDSETIEDPNYVRASPTLDQIDMFDASFFGYSPREARDMDPQHRLFLECSWTALEHAGYEADSYRGNIGVYGGTSMSAYLHFGGNLPVIYHDQIPLLIGNDKDFLTTRVSYKLNLTGPSVNVQTACSTSLVAVHMACQSLLNNECDMSLAGGVSIRIPQTMGYFYHEGGMVSPDGHCRPFDARAQGTTFGSGVGVVVLKRLADAVLDGDTIWGVIKGSAVNNDGSFKAGFTAPSVNKQAEVVETALAVSQVHPETISYIEAHGTATPLGDPIEIEALTQAFRAQTDKSGYCSIGSVKSNIGHLDVAAGVTGLIKAVLALKYGKIPPSLNFQTPNPTIDFGNSPFVVNAKLREWKVSGHPRRAGISSLGVGGTNVHVVVEEAPAATSDETMKSWHILPISAKTSSALEGLTAHLAEHLEKNPELPFEDVANTLQSGRKRFDHRRTLVCVDREDAIKTLLELSPERVFTSVSTKERPVTVFMFSGQGSQYVNMCLDLYDEEPLFRKQVDLCSEILMPHLELDLRELLFPAKSQAEKASEQLTQTNITQPALFTIEYSLAKLWSNLGIKPSALVGHSIGEYVAACVSGVFSLSDALQLVAERGRLMHSLPSGAMLAVPLSEENIKPYLSPEISLAVLNSASISVVSGEVEVITELGDNLQKNGIESTVLHTSHAFHSAMMDPILKEFTKSVDKTSRHAPNLPFVSNLTGTWITSEQATDPEYWANHLRQTVKFYHCAESLLTTYPDGIFLEVGPGQVLSSLLKQHPELTQNHVVL
ncbi:type I polyketide synthase, partial [Thermodesulfobacteriota bacterium]